MAGRSVVVISPRQAVTGVLLRQRSIVLDRDLATLIPGLTTGRVMSSTLPKTHVAETSDNSSRAHGSEAHDLICALLRAMRPDASQTGLDFLLVFPPKNGPLPSQGRSGPNGEECKGTRVTPGALLVHQGQLPL